jgi:anaerobic magnesium-protoporphyrin IX monomethyl ester cyclase
MAQISNISQYTGDGGTVPAPGRAEGRLKLLLMHPKTLVDSWPFPVDTLGEIVKFPSAVYPILAAAIADLPVEIEIFDGYVARCSFAGYKRRLRWPDIIGISCMSPLKAMDTELSIKLAKQLNPGVRIVVGGNHATAWPERWIEAGVDFVVVGEGEIPFRSLMERLVNGQTDFDNVPSLFWNDKGIPRRSTAELPAFDLDASAFPRWDRFDLRPYGMGLSRGYAAAVEISRGCPHRCDFCNINTFWNYKQRYKSVERVIAELRHLRSFGVREFIFTDDNFGGNERHTVALLEAMRTQKLNMRFGCFLRGDTVYRNPAFAGLAARAGMRFCMMGIESLDPTWLKEHRKGVRASDAIEMYRTVYRRLHAEGIFVVGLFICPPMDRPGPSSGVGAPGVVCDYRLSADLVALKGSGIYEKMLRDDAVSKDMFYHDWSLTSILLEGGAAQRIQGSAKDLITENITPFALRSLVSRSPIARRFRLRPALIIAERLLCTTRADMLRRRIALSTGLTMQQRQDLIVATALDPRVIARLARRRHWTSPLSVRTGLWSAKAIRPQST